MVISRWKNGKSVSCIGQILKFSKSTVFNIVRRFKKENSVGNKQRSGRPRKFSEREERRIVRQVRINPRTGTVKLTLKCKCRFRKSVNAETVRKVLRKQKYHGRVPQRKPYITKANLKARLAFAKMCLKQPTEFWENVIFVDESKYNIFGSDSKQKVWLASNTSMHIKNLWPTVKYGGGNQLVWGCMAIWCWELRLYRWFDE
ncbi:hypothetical protein AVEN_16783-1 [Araneus ventricosus]|uniref:Transposase Tc1-like domain-containing protein n=1 Tax=Araneus ventricosus TaxID=182803 RepID=A0A4Y2BSH0_ARAVE|nr:hypothetical protein AVEN_16783-1 [Araneus ventricosus]